MVARHLDLSYDPAMIRPLAGLAVLVLVVGGATGCSRGNELETAYNGCIDRRLTLNGHFDTVSGEPDRNVRTGFGSML